MRIEKLILGHLRRPSGWAAPPTGRSKRTGWDFRGRAAG